MTDPKGLLPYDLALPAKQLIAAAYTPMLPIKLGGYSPARTERERKDAEQLALALGNWENAGITASDERVRAVLELHKPQSSWDGVTCQECASYDNDGDSHPDWPCDTYKAVTG